MAGVPAAAMARVTERVTGGRAIGASSRRNTAMPGMTTAMAYRTPARSAG